MQILSGVYRMKNAFSIGLAALALLAAPVLFIGTALAQESQQMQQSPSPPSQTSSGQTQTNSALLPQQTSGIFLPGGFAFPSINNPITDQKESEKKKKYRYKGDSSTVAPMPPRLFNNIPKRRLND